MKLPDTLTGQLRAGETVLWHSKAASPDKLSDYTGPHEWIARVFFAISSLMTVIFFFGMQSAGRMGLTWPLLFFVGGPIVIGLVIRSIGRRRMRSKAQASHFAVTSERVLIKKGDAIQKITISNDTPDDVLTNSSAAEMGLPPGQPAKAHAAIQHVKAAL